MAITATPRSPPTWARKAGAPTWNSGRAASTAEGWWTSLYLPEEIIKLYNDHDTSEQLHSEFKTDMDLERLPSGKFDTNALVMALAGLGNL